MSVKIDRMRFQANHLSYRLGFMGFLLYIAYISSTLDYIPKTWVLGLEIIISLAFLMVLFQGIEAVKNYSVKWSYISIALGVITSLRVFWLPPVIKESGLEQIAFISALTIVLTGVFILICGIVGLKRGSALAKYLKATGLINSFNQDAGSRINDNK